MTWKHVALVLLAVALTCACIVTQSCASDHETLHTVIALSGTIVGGVLGHAGKERADAP